MKDYLSIKEFSEMTGIEQSTLRYWDKIGVFGPEKRGDDNNYRYYSPKQIITVKFITVLSKLNTPLKSIIELGKERTPESVVDVLSNQEKMLNMEMRRLVENFAVITARLQVISYGTKLLRMCNLSGGTDGANASSGQFVGDKGIFILHRERESFVLGPPNKFIEDEKFYEPFMNFCKHAKDLRINLNYPIGGYHKSMESFLEAPGKPDRFLSLEPTGNHIRPAGEYLVGLVRGYYGELGDLPERMEAYIKKNSLTVSGPVYFFTLHDEICGQDSSQYLGHVCVAVKRSVSERREPRKWL